MLCFDYFCLLCVQLYNTCDRNKRIKQGKYMLQENIISLNFLQYIRKLKEAHM